MNIRTKLLPGDLTYILTAHTHHYGDSFGYGPAFEVVVMRALAEFHATLDGSRNRLWIVENKGERLGSLVLQDRGEAAQLRLFYLAPQLRGQGLGRKLLTDLIVDARSAGFTSVHLWTSDEQPAAIHLYLDAGFELEEVRLAATFGRVVKEMCFRARFD